MKQIIIVLLVIILIFLEGCTVAGAIIDTQINKKNRKLKLNEPLSIEDVESMKRDTAIKIDSKDYGIIKGRFLSFKNDTLHVKINDSDYKRISGNIEEPELVLREISYTRDIYGYSEQIYTLMIPVDRINSIVAYEENTSKLFALGLIFDFCVVLALIINPIGPDIHYGSNKY